MGGGGCSSREQVCTRGIPKSKHEDLLAATWFQGKAVDPSLLVEREPDTGRRSVALTEEGRLSPLCRWRS